MTRAFANREELMIALMQGEKWSPTESKLEYCLYAKINVVSPFRHITRNDNKPADLIYLFCNGHHIWHKVEEKAELDLMKEKYTNGDYIAIYKVNQLTKEWIIVTKFFYDASQYRLIHKKHKDILDSYLADNSVKIEIKCGVKWELVDTDFIIGYREDSVYRIKPEIWIKTTTISLAMYTCYDARTDCWINPIMCETMEECKAKVDESYFSSHMEIPSTRFEITVDKDSFQRKLCNTKLVDLTVQQSV